MFIRFILAEIEEIVSPYSSNVEEVPDLTDRKVVLLKDNNVLRRLCSLARIVKVLPSDDGRVREVIVRVHRVGKILNTPDLLRKLFFWLITRTHL